MNGSLPLRERGQEAQNVVQMSPNTMPGLQEQQKLSRERVKQAGGWTQHISCSIIDF